jgi:tetratricopeptide (TPR) repeat protein
VDDRTAQSVLVFAEEARTRLTGLEGSQAMSELEERHDELLAALDWFADQGRADEAFRLATAMVPFWMATKRLDEGDAAFARILALSDGDEVRRGRALFDHGYLIFWAGRYDESAALQQRALEIGRAQNDPTVTALALGGLARIALRTDVEEAKRLLREAIAVTEGTDDRIGRSGAMHVLGVAAQMSGDLEEARRLMSERIALARETGNLVTVASESGNLSMVERQLGNLAAAEALSLEALAISHARGDEMAIAWMVNGLAAVTAAKGELGRAAILVGVADGAMERAGGEWPPDERVQYDATVAALMERLGEAAFAEARARGAAMTTEEGVAFALAGATTAAGPAQPTQEAVRPAP